MKFTIADKARADLLEIAQYIARDNPDRARSYIVELNEKIRAVAREPELYAVKESWGRAYRSALHQRYHIIFRIEADQVVFVRVLHGARDIASELGKK